MADPLLKAYAATILAKDASSRYSNPRRALNNYDSIMEAASGVETKEDFKGFAKAAIKEALGEAGIEPKVESTQQVQQTIQPQYVTRKDLNYFKNDLLKTVKSLIPPPKDPPTPPTP